MSHDRQFFVLGATFAMLGMAAGAFGAHALKTRLTPDLLAVFETGTHYHLIHALALLGVAWASTHWNSPAIVVAGWLFVAGILLFSGSLYALSLTGVRLLGIITPFGGVALILGWLTLAWGVWKQR